MAQNLALLGLGCLVAFGLVEAGLRIWEPQPMMYWPDPVLGWTHIPGGSYALTDKETGRVISVTINSKGLRDVERPYDKPNGVLRVVVLGDSFTEGTFVELADAYPKWLESLLTREGRPAEVINTGVGGYGTDQELLFLTREGLNYRPDLVVLGFYIGNDVIDNMTKSIYKLEAGYLVFDDRRATSRWRRALTLLKAWAQSHFQTYFFVRQKTAQLYLVRKVLGDLGLVEAYDAEQVRKGLPHDLRILLREYSDDLWEGWRLTTAILTRMNGVVRGAGAHLLVVVIPSLYQVDAGRRARALGEWGVEESALDVEKPGRILAEWGATHGVTVLDLLPELRGRTERGEKLYLDEGHWNARGHALAASLIRDMLVSLGFVGGTGAD